MRYSFWFVATILILAHGNTWAQPAPKPVVMGLKSPTAITAAPGGKVYVVEAGQTGKDGAVLLLGKDKTKAIYTGLENPQSIAAYQQWLFVTDKKGIWKIDAKGKATLFAPVEKFPTPPGLLRDITVDPENGVVYVADVVDLQDKGGQIYRLDPKGKIDVVNLKSGQVHASQVLKQWFHGQETHGNVSRT